MLETVIPFVVHSGITTIYTIGWDGPKNNKYKTFFGDDQSVFTNEDKKILANNIVYGEFLFIKYVKKMFENKELSVHKCSQNSGIKLKHLEFDILKKNK